jgi:hypothetical protein
LDVVIRFGVDDQVAAELSYDVRTDEFVATAFGDIVHPHLEARAQTFEAAVRALAVKVKAVKSGSL